MKNSPGSTLLSASAVLALTFVVTSLAPPGALHLARPGAVHVGDLVQYNWRTPLVNGMGVSSLEDLRGKPVLINFWGTRCPPCIGGAVPASTKLQEIYGDDLQVIFVESQGTKPAQVEGFSLARCWLGGRAMWTSEQPFETGATMLPYFVLVGNDGRVLLMGNPLAQPKEIERQIGEQIKNRKNAPGDAPKYLKPAWSELNSGKIAKAFEALQAVEVENAGRSEVLDVVHQTEKEFRARVETELKRVKWLIDNGYFDEAGNRLDELKRSTRGEEGLYKRCGELALLMDAPELKAEREAAKTLARLLPDFFRKGGDAATSSELARFAEKYKGTKAAGRAEHLTKLPKG